MHAHRSADSADASADASKTAEQSADSADPNAHHTTLYLSHLPPTLTSPQLTLIFSSYAPVRAAFVVSSSQGGAGNDAPAFAGSSANMISLKAGRDRTGKVASRGFGYVRFVLRSDAEQCLVEWGGKDGLPRSAVRELEGQAGLEGVNWDEVCGSGGIRMSWAKKKLREGEKPEGGEKRVKKEKKGADGADDEEKKPAWDYNAPRTVVIMGLPVQPRTDAAGDAEAEGAEEDKEAGDESAMQVDEADEGAAAEGEDDGEKKGKELDWKKAIRQRARKIGEVENVRFPWRLASGEQAGACFPTLLNSAQLTRLRSQRWSSWTRLGTLTTS